MKLIFLVVFSLQVSIFLGSCYVVGSVAVSTIKAATMQCGTTYQIESVVNGNWFCPK